MKSLVTFSLVLGVSLSTAAWAEQQNYSQSGSSQQTTQSGVSQEQQSSQFEGDDTGTSYQSKTVEKVGTRKPIQYSQPDVKAQLQQAKQNVKVDEQNIQKAEAKKRDDEAQVDIDKATIKKYEAQLEEDKAHLERLEKKVEQKKE